MKPESRIIKERPRLHGNYGDYGLGMLVEILAIVVLMIFGSVVGYLALVFFQ